jgi:hypothetical protein
MVHQKWAALVVAAVKSPNANTMAVKTNPTKPATGAAAE